jgi:hypothetical protein
LTKIVWIASYPRSGNTWTRFILANLLFGKLDNSTDLQRKVPDIHTGIAGAHLWGKGTTLIKTHWMWVKDMPLREDTAGAIYVVRNPIDVMESNQHFSMLRSGGSLKKAKAEAKVAAARAFIDQYLANGGHPNFLKFGLGSWEENLRGWTAKSLAFPRLVVRYEDMKADTAKFAKLFCKFLKVERSDRQIADALARSSLDAMREMEEREIKTRTEGYFFQSRNVDGYEEGLRFVGGGLDGPRKSAMTEAQQAKALEKFGPAMKRLGYL